MTFYSFAKLRLVFFSLVAVASFLIVIANASQALAESLDTTLNEQIVMLPVTEHGENFEFETTIFKPSGHGPFPLLLMNHGKERGDPHQQKRDRFLAISREFVRRGYAVTTATSVASAITTP